MKTVLLLSFTVVLILPLGVCAQSSDVSGSSPSVTLPGPITDFMNSLDKIKLDNSVVKLPDNLQGGGETYWTEDNKRITDWGMVE